MSSPIPQFELLDGRLRVHGVERLDDLDVRALQSGARLFLVMDLAAIAKDPLAHRAFHDLVDESRGDLLLVDAGDDFELVSALPPCIEVARQWLDEGPQQRVEVVVLDSVLMPVVATALHIAMTNERAAVAVTKVFELLDEVPSPDNEIACQVFAEKLTDFRAWRDARRLRRREVTQ